MLLTLFLNKKKKCWPRFETHTKLVIDRFLTRESHQTTYRSATGFLLCLGSYQVTCNLYVGFQASV